MCLFALGMQDITCMDPELDWPLYEQDVEAARARQSLR